MSVVILNQIINKKRKIKLPFITTWNVTSSTITLPFYKHQIYCPQSPDCIVDWGDGGQTTIVNDISQAITHTYSTQGTYTITISGKVPGWSFSSNLSMIVGIDRNKIKTVQQWGDVGMVYLEDGFGNCQNLISIAPNIPKTVLSFKNCFKGCINLDIPNNLFNNCIYSNNFNSTFEGCDKLVIKQNIFGNCFDLNPRSVVITRLFNRNAYSGLTIGKTPQLWNKDKINWNIGTGNDTPFYGNSQLMISNYNDIPVQWK